MKRITLKKVTAAGAGVFDVVDFRGRARTAEGRRDLWMKERMNGVGGSDMPIILGISPWRTPYDLWLEKTGRKEPEDINGKWAVEKGRLLENALRRRFRDNHPELAVLDGTDMSFVSKEHPCMHASLDGILFDPDQGWGVLEIKTTNMASARTDWHDADGALMIPDHYLAQVTHYMAVTGFTWGVVMADLGVGEPVEIGFTRDEEDVNAAIDAAESFWRCVESGDMPALTGPDVAKAYPDPQEDMLDLTGHEDTEQLLEQYDAARSVLKDAKEEADRLKDAIIVAIGDHEGVTAGGFQATYRHYSRTIKPSEGRTIEGRTFKFTTRKDK